MITKGFEKKMAEYKLFLQRIGLIGITQLLTSFSGVILLPILTKNLPIEEYGIWAQMLVTIGIFPGIVMLGLPYTMVRFLAALNKKEEIQEIFYSIFVLVLLTSGIASLFLYISSGVVAPKLFDDNIRVVKLLSIIVFFECLINLFVSYLRARQQIKKYSFIVFFNAAAQILTVSTLVLLGKGIIGASIGLLITDLLTFVILAFIIILDVGIRIPKFKNIKEYLNFGIPTVLGNFSNWIVNASDRYVIGLLIGTAYVGYYSPGYSLGNLINIFIGPLVFLLPSVLSKYYDENNVYEVQTVLSYSLRYLMAISIPAAFGLSFLSKPILTILSTPEIAAQGYLITPFVALSTLLYGAYVIVAQAIALKKKTVISGRIWVIAATLNLVLNFLIIPYLGIIGAAITTLFAFLVSLGLTIHYSSKFLKFDTNLAFMLKSILASILMSLIIVLYTPESLFEIMLTICVCVPVYFIALFLLKGFGKQEFKLLYDIIKTDT
ncbi:hypothetical protein MSKOL_0714 [Methanosarcina sp. Kolksee]|nr:hypothetical protein MSKOL_0714 [Methanosarcina sp. Kolksee]